MTDYISREAVLALADDFELTLEDDEIFFEYIAPKNVKALPAADVRPVKRGVWCPQPSDFEDCTVFACSNCGHMILISNDREELPYCGNCGAEMEVGE